MTLIHAHSGYHKFKLDKRSSYVAFACQFGRYRSTRLPFRVAPAGDILKWGTKEIFKNLSNVYHIADDILIVGYDTDSRDHDKTLKQVMQTSKEENLTLGNKKIMSF